MLTAYKFRLYPETIRYEEVKTFNRSWKHMNSFMGGCHTFDRY